MQLDLFTEGRGPAIVYRFPLARRAVLVRATAHELCIRAYEDGRRYWNAHAKDMRRALKASGLSRGEIDQEIAAYSRVVREHVYAAFDRRMTR